MVSPGLHRGDWASRSSSDRAAHDRHVGRGAQGADLTSYHSPQHDQHSHWPWAKVSVEWLLDHNTATELDMLALAVSVGCAMRPLGDQWRQSRLRLRAAKIM
jgi:hypothetical protein